jgi:hypothetical protein
MLPALEKLTDQVEKNKQVVSSAVMLITGLAKQIVINKNSPAKIQALADELSASSADLAQAIMDNTPAEDEEEVEDPTDPTDPEDPVGPVDPTDPIEPIEPIEPEDPADPTGPIDPMSSQR